MDELDRLTRKDGSPDHRAPRALGPSRTRPRNRCLSGAELQVRVHQDGLVHISAMANAYVKDPRKIAKPGDVVRVKVLDVEPKRRRISLTMRLDQAPEARPTIARADIAPTGSDKRPRPVRAGP